LSDDIPKIKVFASDDNLKALGELLSNDSSRKIIYNLMTKEMYTNEISTKLDMRVSLVIHHLKKMEELGMMEITNKKIKRKGQEHRFFKIYSDIFVTVNKTKEEIEEKGFLKKIFKEGVKFTSIGVLGTISWALSLLILKPNVTLSRTVPSQIMQSFEYQSLIIALSVCITGLIIERVLNYKKN